MITFLLCYMETSQLNILIYLSSTCTILINDMIQAKISNAKCPVHNISGQNVLHSYSQDILNFEPVFYTCL